MIGGIAQNNPLRSAPASPAFTQDDSIGVDVVVLDKRGQRVTNLRQQDLNVIEDGVAQNILSVSGRVLPLHESTLVEGAATDRNVHDELYTNLSLTQAEGGDRKLFLLIDELNTSKTQRSLVLDKLAVFLENTDLASHLTIYGLAGDLSLLQDYSGDPRILLSAIQTMKAHTGESLSFITPENGTTFPPPASSREGPLDFLGAVKNLIGFRQEPELADRRRATLAALKSIARAAQGIEGRKSLIWFSGSFPCPTSSAASLDRYECSGEQSDSQVVLRTLQEARLSVYPVNATQVKTRSEDRHPVSGFERSPRGSVSVWANSSATFRRDLASRDLAMEQVADITGGRALRGKGLAEAIQVTRDDDDRSIEIRLASSHMLDGSAHTISISSSHPGTTTLYRRILFERQAPPMAENDEIIHEELVNVLTDRLQATGIILTARKVDQSRIELLVDARSLSFELQSDGKFKTEFDVATAALSPSYRMLTGNSDRFSRLLTPKELQDARRSGLRLHLGYAPHPHAQWIRLLVRDSRSGRLGTIDIPLKCCDVLR